jgi:hypothetical protein
LVTISIGALSAMSVELSPAVMGALPEVEALVLKCLEAA